MKFRGGGATRKTGSCSGLDLCHSSVKGNLSLKPLKKTCLEASDEKFLRHSELDSESINADKDRLRLAGRSDESSQITNSSFRHSELDSESLNKSIDSGSGAGMTKISSNNLCPAGQTNNTSRKAAFTMAEVLITLGIIGIVAAMTLPSLIGRWKDKEYEVRAKRTFSLINQAIERYEAESGMIGDFSALFDTSQTSQAVLKHFSEYFESPTLCLTRSDNCSKYVYYVKYSSPLFDENGDAMADGIGISPPLMVLKDGSIVTVKQFDKCEWNYSGTSYNPDGTVKVDENGNPIIYDWVLHYCASIFFDTNGISPPNQAGADVFEIRINKDGQFTGWGNSGWTSLQSILSGLGPVYTRYSEGQKKKP